MRILRNIQRINKTIGLLCKLYCVSPRPSLLKMYKLFARPHLDYDDQANNNFFQNKIIQFKITQH